MASPRPTDTTGRSGVPSASAAGRQERSRATARDVADLVPCSVATVSLVVNGKAAGRVKPEIEQRVWHAVGQLNYQVNSSASALARQRPNTVALVFPDPTDPFFSMVLDGILSALGDEFRLNLFAPRTAEDYGPDTVQRAMAGDLAGLIVGRPGPTILDGLTPSCPVVVLDAGGRCGDVTSIDPDIGSAAADLADHLVGLGHRRVAYAGVQRADETPLPRRAALRAELHRRGADLVGPDVLVPRLSMEEAQRAFAAQWPALDHVGVTAVVCGDDVLAYGVLAAAQAGGIDIPGRLSVAAMFGLPYSATVSPPLTTIDVDARELGIRGVAALRAQVDGRTRPFSETVPASLVIRRSTASPA